MNGPREIIRWGIIGCGDVTEVKSGPALQRATGSALVAVMRRDRAKAEDYARRHGVPRSYDDALAVAQAGKPVYVEKPMALSHAECTAMIDGCARAGVPLFVAYYRRALP